MTRSSVRRMIAVALLGLFLAASLASAAEPRARIDVGAGIAAPSLWGLLDEIWRFLSSASFWSKCGASPDPNGACKSQPADVDFPVAPDAGAPTKCGASADPDGACKSQPTNGGSSATPFAGASPDPDG